MLPKPTSIYQLLQHDFKFAEHEQTQTHSLSIYFFLSVSSFALCIFSAYLNLYLSIYVFVYIYIHIYAINICLSISRNTKGCPVFSSHKQSHTLSLPLSLSLSLSIIYRSIYLCGCLSIYPSNIYQSICVSFYFYQSIHPSIHLFIYPSIYQSI